MSDAPLTLYARLRDELRAQILSGSLRPRDKLPSEAEFSERHGVSRITVRQALGDLQKEGLIVRQQGKGAFVAPPQRASQSLNRLQGLGEALAGQGQAVHSQRLDMRRCTAPAQACTALGLAAGTEVWQMTMLRYVDRQPISVNCSWFGLALGERMARLDLSGRDVITVLEHDLGQTITRSDLEITATAMPADVAMHLQVSPGAPAMCVMRTLFDAAGQALQAETMTYRAEAFSYKLSLERHPPGST